MTEDPENFFPDSEVRQYNTFIKAVWENRFFTGYGIYGMAYKIEYPEAHSLNQKNYEDINANWARAFRDMPIGTCIGKYDFYIKRQWESKKKPKESLQEKALRRKRGFWKWDFDKKEVDWDNLPDENYLTECTDVHFEGREYLEHSGYLFFSYPKTYLQKKAYNPFDIPDTSKMGDYDQEERDFENEVNKAIDIINLQGFIQVTPMTEKELRDYEDFWMNGMHPKRLADLFFDKEPLRIEADGHYIGMLSIGNEEQFPPVMATERTNTRMSKPEKGFTFYEGFMDNLGMNLDCEHVYCQNIIISDHKATIKEMKDRRGIMWGLRGFDSQNKVNAEHLDIILKECADDPALRFIHGSNTVMYWAESQSELERLDRKIRSTVESMDFHPKKLGREDYKELYLNGFPANVSLLPYRYWYMTYLDTATMMFVNTTNYKSDERGVYFQERLFNTPISYDFWDAEKKRLKSRNFMIVAPTGQGKSFTANHILSQLIEDDCVCVVVDLGGSYKKLASLYPKDQVAMFSYQPSLPLNLNPFDLGVPKAEVDNDTLIQKVEDVSEFIWLLVKRGEEVSEVEQTSLRKIVRFYYDFPGIEDKSYSFSHFYNWLASNQQLVLRSLMIDNTAFFDMQEFIHNGSEFIEGGMYANILKVDQDTSVQMKGKKLIVFELDDVKDNKLVLAILLQVISSTIQQVIWSDKKTKGVVFFDEFGKQLEFPLVLNRVKYYAQAIRKQEGALGVVLQSLNQLPETPEAKTILDNTETFIFLEKSDGDYSATIERLKLDEHDQTQLKSLCANFKKAPKYSEIYLKRGRKSNVYRIEAAPEVYLAFQTEGPIHTALEEEYKKCGSMRLAIENYKNKNNL